MARGHMMRVVGGGAGVLLLAALFFLARAASDYARQRDVVKKCHRQLKQLNERTPFPSEENVRRMLANRDALASVLDGLKGELAQDPFPMDIRDPADFSARAQQGIEELRRRAQAAGIKLPERFEAGFSQYVGAGAVPDAKHVPRLSRQLYSVERVARVLIEGGASLIDSLTREAFEQEPADALAGRARRRGRDERNAPAAIGGRLVASYTDPDGLYTVERIGVSFSAEESAVWKVLDGFATAPHFMVVVSFAHRTQTKIMQYDPEAARRAQGGDAGTAGYLAGGLLTGKQALPRSERIVAGHDPVSVSLVVDVYDFDPVAREVSP